MDEFDTGRERERAEPKPRAALGNTKVDLMEGAYVYVERKTT